MVRASGFRVAVLLAVAAVLVPQSAWPDVLPPSTDAEWPTVALSLEAVGSLERPLSDRQSVSLWGGVGSIWGSVEGDQSLGVELATEIRAYTRRNVHTGFNGGAYIGIGVLNSDFEGTRFTVTPGVKFTLSTQMPSAWMLLEPYVGVSFPLVTYLEGDERESSDALVATLGLRVVFRRLSAWSEGTGPQGLN